MSKILPLLAAAALPGAGFLFGAILSQPTAREGRGASAPGWIQDPAAQEKKELAEFLKLYGLAAPDGVRKMQKIVAGRQLWNYDNLEPTEKKLIL